MAHFGTQGLFHLVASFFLPSFLHLTNMYMPWVCCVALLCCLFDLACFFLPSFFVSLTCLQGPYFAPEYEPIPEDVHFLYDGKVMKLTESAEEAAGFFAKMLDHDYTKKDVFCENFFADWRKVVACTELIHSLTHSLTHSTHSLTHSLFHSLTHRPTHSFTHSLTHSLTPLTHSLTHSPTHSLIHPPTHSLTHSLFPRR